MHKENDKVLIRSIVKSEAQRSWLIKLEVGKANKWFQQNKTGYRHGHILLLIFSEMHFCIFAFF